MKLLDLTLEIVQAIAEEIVIGLGPFKAQRLRLVNKLFKREIRRAIYATRVIDSHPANAFREMDFQTEVGYLETRTLSDPRGTNELTTVIQRTVDILLEEVKPHSNRLRLEYTHVVCSAAAAYPHQKLGTGVLDKLKALSISNDYANTDVKDVFTAAAFVGVSKSYRITSKDDIVSTDGMDEAFRPEDIGIDAAPRFATQQTETVGNASLLRKLIDQGVDIDAESQYFGRALRGAALGGHDAKADSVPLSDLDNRSLFRCPFRAMQSAVKAGHDPVVGTLTELGAKKIDTL